MLERDERLMARALALAERGAGQVAPNPKVGAVVAHGDEVVGEGWHARYGGPHAEIVALRDAGERARGATVYVTLEPCNHHGQTPPCTEALIAAGVARVVFAVRDPNPVAAGGASRLADAGIATTAGVLERDAENVNALFLGAIEVTGRPFVTLKLALSVDGAIVGPTRARTQLTGAESRERVHRMRAENDAIAVGVDTAIADDAALTVRDAPLPRVAPTRVVFDRTARLPLAGTLVRTAAETPVMVITDGTNPSGERALAESGVTVLPARSEREALAALRARGIRTLLVEGGAGLASSLIAARLVDQLVIFQAPVILGAGSLAAFGSLSQDAAGPMRLEVRSREQLGGDVLSVYRVRYAD